jgi:hypothetical protein
MPTLGAGLWLRVIVLSYSLFGVLRELRALEQVSRFSLRVTLTATVLVAAPKASPSDARLFQASQGAGRSEFPIFGNSDTGHQFLHEMGIRRT